jgi:hypothetical protein
VRSLQGPTGGTSLRLRDAALSNPRAIPGTAPSLPATPDSADPSASLGVPPRPAATPSGSCSPLPGARNSGRSGKLVTAVPTWYQAARPSPETERVSERNFLFQAVRRAKRHKLVGTAPDGPAPDARPRPHEATPLYRTTPLPGSG